MKIKFTFQTDIRNQIDFYFNLYFVFQRKLKNKWQWFFLIGIHSMQGWTATTLHGVTTV